MPRTHYDVLGVGPLDDVRTIKAAYLALIKRYHPDRIGAHGLRLTQEINAAVHILGNKERRASYDAELRLAGAEARSSFKPGRRSRPSRHRRGAAGPSSRPERCSVLSNLAGAGAGYAAGGVLFEALDLARSVIERLWPWHVDHFLALATLAAAIGVGYVSWLIGALCAGRSMLGSEESSYNPSLLCPAFAFLSGLRMIFVGASLAVAATEIAFLAGVCLGWRLAPQPSAAA